MRRWRRRSLAFAVGALLASLGAHAFEIERAESKYHDKQYSLSLELVLDAPRDRVQAVLRDYDNYRHLDARILEAKILKREAPNELLLYTKLRACFAVFCKNVKRVERVQESANDLYAVVLPEQSEVARGETHTHLTALDGRTRVVYDTRLAPGFWIPPFIGRPLMLRTLREATLDLFRNVEMQARGGGR